MRGGALPPALLAAALGFLLAFAPRKAIGPALVLFLVAALIAGNVRTGPGVLDMVFYGCWASVIVTALSIHVPRLTGRIPAIVLAANAGLWAGAVIAATGHPPDLAKALPWALLCLPGTWLVSRRMGLGIKVVASWLIAVAILAAVLPTTTATPGYAPDHME